MSTVEKITQLSHRIFNTSANEQNTSRTSNPFAVSNFQKNILTEDVFESSKAKEAKNVSFTGNLSAGSKRIYSTFVGSLSDLGSKFYEGIENIVAFSRKVWDGVVNTWNKIQEIGNKEINLEGAKNVLNKEISLDGAKNVLSMDITSLFAKPKEREIAKMAKMDPHSEVKPMLKEALSALEADMTAAA